MPPYVRMGQLPPKRHTQFKKKDGSLYCEEVFGTEGFNGVQSILYHHHPPLRVTKLSGRKSVGERSWDPGQHRHHHLRCGKVPSEGDAVAARRVVAFNDDCRLTVATPTARMRAYFRNGSADELWFVRNGEGSVETVFGKLAYREGDYVLIPRGTTYRFADGVGHRFFLVESPGPITFPQRYVNASGQFMEHAPFCERDLHGPTELASHAETGDFEVQVKIGDEIGTYHFATHPLDVVGWDGCNYPFTFNIADFEPITGRIHQPPPVHETFCGPHFMVASFVPRMLDYHPLSIPAPYYHSNIDTDEVLYYVHGEFTSRKGVEVDSMTIHRRGLHHGPQPGRYEGSIGRKFADETAIMVEAEGHFQLTQWAKDVDDGEYMRSWL